MQSSINFRTKAKLRLYGRLVHPEPIRLQDELFALVGLHVNRDIAVTNVLKQGLTGTLELIKGGLQFRLWEVNVLLSIPHPIILNTMKSSSQVVGLASESKRHLRLDQKICSMSNEQLRLS